MVAMVPWWTRARVASHVVRAHAAMETRVGTALYDVYNTTVSWQEWHRQNKDRMEIRFNYDSFCVMIDI